MNRIIATLVALGGLWLFGLLLAFLNFWPLTGRSGDWLWFLLVAPPAALLLHAAGEFYSEWWQSTRLAQAIQERTENKRFSWLRVAVALLSVGLVTVVVGGFALWIR